MTDTDEELQRYIRQGNEVLTGSYAFQDTPQGKYARGILRWFKDRAARLDERAAALRAVPPEGREALWDALAEARAAYATQGIAGASGLIKRVFDVLDETGLPDRATDAVLLTPEPSEAIRLLDELLEPTSYGIDNREAFFEALSRARKVRDLLAGESPPSEPRGPFCVHGGIHPHATVCPVCAPAAAPPSPIDATGWTLPDHMKHLRHTLEYWSRRIITTYQADEDLLRLYAIRAAASSPVPAPRPEEASDGLSER